MRQRGKVAWLAVAGLALSLMAATIQAQEPMAPTAPAALGGVISGGRISLKVGETQVIKGVESYEIADSRIASITPTADGDVIVKAVSGGASTLLIRKKGVMGMFSYDVQVEGRDVETVLQEVKAALGQIVGILITREGNVVALEGQIGSRDDGKRIDVQVKKFGDTILDLTERTYFKQDLDRLLDELRKGQYNLEAESVMGENGKKVLSLRGTVFSQQQKDNVMNIASRFFDKDSIIDSIAVDLPQVEVDIEAYAFDLSKARDVGSRDQDGNFNDILGKISRMSFASSGWTILTGPYPAGGGPGLTGGRTIYPTLTMGKIDEFYNGITAILGSGAGTNIMKQHASVRSGETATVENINNDKIRVAGAFDAKLVDVKTGQILEVSPVVLESGRFETKVRVTLSERLPGPPGGDIPVRERNYTGTYVSGKDEVVVLGGGNQTATVDVIDKTPFLHWIPLVGPLLFQNRRTEKQDRTVIFFMSLRAPTLEAAEGPSQGSQAKDEKSKIEDKSEKKDGYMESNEFKQLKYEKEPSPLGQ